MRILPRQLQEDRLSYISSSEADSVRKFAEILFMEKKQLRDSLNLTGRFTGNDQFELKRYRFQIKYLSCMDYRARVKVQFYKNEQGLTRFDLQVFPNRSYAINFVLQPLACLLFIFITPAVPHAGFYAALIVIVLISTIAFLMLGTISKNNLRDKCVALFKLRPLI